MTAASLSPVSTFPEETALRPRADARLWHQTFYRENGFVGRIPLWARAGDDIAVANLATLGLQVALGQWVAINADEATVKLALGTQGRLELASAPRHIPLGGLSLAAVGGKAVHAGRGLAAKGYSGRGVLIGTIDTGIDHHHLAFARRKGGSRIVAIWDQDGVHGPSPMPFNYGVYCDEQALLGGHCAIDDPVGHGTHVAGIAAGNAHVCGGLAPGADVAVVRSVAFDRLADAVAFLTNLADTRHQPLALNISVGGHYGPHDGHSPLEQFLAARSGPGRIFVVAAGNEGDRALHVAAQVNGTASVEHRVILKPGLQTSLDSKPAPKDALVELWGDGAEPYAVAVELWQHGHVQRRQNIELDATRRQHTQMVIGDNLSLSVVARHEATRHNEGVKQRLGLSVVVQAFDSASLLPGDELVLAVSSFGSPKGWVHGWISALDGSSSPLTFGAPQKHQINWVAGDDQATISVPATSPHVITVGSYTVQNAWRDFARSRRGVPREFIGLLSSFSSHGPTGMPLLTGVKPDLTAPGSVVVSARAAGLPDTPDTLGPLTMVMQGTSMAAPHVTGTAALMLEADPSLDTERARTLLQEHATADWQTGAVPNHRWGYGRLDALATVRAAENQTGGGCAQAQPGFSGYFMLFGASMRAWQSQRLAAKKRRRS